MKYLSKNWNFDTNQQAPSSLGMYSVLATRGVQYLMNDLLTNFRNRGLVDRLMKLPETGRENVLVRFITLYLKAAYTGIITQSSRENDVQPATADAQQRIQEVTAQPIVTEQSQVAQRSQRKRSVETQTTGGAITGSLSKRGRRSDDIQLFANSAIAGQFITTLNLGCKLISAAGWQVSLAYDPTIPPLFRLVCKLCNVFLKTSPMSTSHFRLCPDCFKTLNREKRKYELLNLAEFVLQCDIGERNYT
ncbi:unnamed protein product [Gongylonema pulchrum]|uniref:DNA-directed RNA polymerase n=1 Tax=Gongylonema pulchrum TaxID=637853 RepID=A0A183EQ23_9BILA|nr:unnamed protein product [Gongylonema pulchrum]